MKGFAVKTLTYDGASSDLHREGLEMLRTKLGINLTAGTTKPSILLFLTGGSEAEAIKHLDRDNYQLLVASGRSNAYASAVEVKAYSNQNNFRNSLFNLDDTGDFEELGLVLDVLVALDNLKGKRLRIIGNESGWLVASGVEDAILKEKLGIQLVRIPWPVAGGHESAGPDKEFIKKFEAGKQFNIEGAQPAKECHCRPSPGAARRQVAETHNSIKDFAEKRGSFTRQSLFYQRSLFK